jgi:FkbM family methyltransferase
MNYEPHLDKLVAISKRFWKPEEVKTILEIGARDGVETCALHDFFPEATIYTFECNPATIPLWKQNTAGIDKIVTVEKAVSDKDGSISFFPIDPEHTKSDWKDGNPGASSLLVASGKYPVEQYAQKEITVATTTLKTFFKEKNIPGANIVWMDIQGAELMALRGLEERIADLGIIHTEIEFIQIYKDQPLATEIKKYMNDHGFYLGYFTNFGPYAGDAVFVNKSLVSKRPFMKTYLGLRDKTLYPFHKSVRNAKEAVKKMRWWKK